VRSESLRATTLALPAKYDVLSRLLHESLPSRGDIERICKVSRHPSVLAHELMTLNYTTLDQEGLKTPETLLEIPGADLHPVLIARYMLSFAIFLQNLHPDLERNMKDLSESPRAIMERLITLAVSHITTNDELLGSIEGLECVMIEAAYQTNIGNLRRGWLSTRRAMAIAQLMSLDRSDCQAQFKVLDSKSKFNPELMWFRIVFLDRYLCLLLGLSQGCLDRSMASSDMLAKDTPMGRLERVHCIIASGILERNASKPSPDDLVLTRKLDVELQKAARTLPSKWWLLPNLDPTSDDSEGVFWSSRRLFAQLFHYNLLNQLHLPYMLRASSSEGRYEYSRITCVNASREVLSRFIALRDFNGNAYSCRTVDFLALMAAMTLLLAHLDSNTTETENLLVHQYHSDRAMIEQMQENMKEVNRLNQDALSAQSSDLLGQLLAIEVEAADNDPSYAPSVRVQETGFVTAVSDGLHDGSVRVHVPYFGVINITGNGISPRVNATAGSSTNGERVSRTSIPESTEGLYTEAQMPRSRHFQSTETLMTSMETSNSITSVDVDTDRFSGGERSEIPRADTSHMGLQFVNELQSDISSNFLYNGDYLELAAGGEDWGFQGVDMAFFESLMRSSGH